jgi:anti-sigma factor RsiW
MNCSDYVEWIAQKLDGTLPEQQRRELEDHSSHCDRCRAELLLQSKIHQALAQEPGPGLSPDFAERVTRRVLARAKAYRRARWFRTLAPVFAFAGGVVLLYLVRADLARALPPMMDVLADAISAPIAWLGDLVLGFLGRISNLSGQRIPVLEQMSGPLMTTLTVTVIGTVPAIWAFYRIFAFLKE